MVKAYKFTAMEYYKIVRTEIEHEDDLISQRLTWLVNIQAILFGALFLLLTGGAPPALRDRLSLTILAVVGVSDVILIFGIVLAFAAVRRLRSRFYEQLALQKENPEEYPDPVVSNWGNIFGLVVALALPVLFFVAWVYVSTSPR
jgi:hypothetical protein